MTHTAAESTTVWPPVLPREHGSWGTFLGLMLAALLVVGVDEDVLLTMVAGLGLFLAREPLSQGVRLRFGRSSRPVPRRLCFWAGLYLLISASVGSLLLARGLLWGLLWLALAGLFVLVVHLALVARRLMMTAWGEWIGVLGVSLIVPALYLAAVGQLDVRALGLWLIGLAQVTGPIFYIRLKVRVQSRTQQAPPVVQRLIIAWRPLLFSAISLAGAALLGHWGWAPAWAWLALLPSTLKSLWGALDWAERGQLDIRRQGWLEVLTILLFALLLGGAYRWG